MQVPEGWKLESITKHLQEYRGGASLKPSDFCEQGVVVFPKKGVDSTGVLKISPNDLTFVSKEYAKSNEKSLVNASYIVTTLRDLVPTGPSIGRIVKITDKKQYIIAQGVYGFKLKKTLDTDFLIQVSNSSDFRKSMRIVMVGSTQVHIRNSEYFDVKVPIPPLSEQKKIAEILSACDECIENTEKQIAKLKDLKKATMQELLTKGIGHTEFKDSPLGRIPKSWAVVKLGDYNVGILDGDRGKEYPKEKDFHEREYCLFLSAKNITKNGFRWSDCQFINKDKDQKLRKGRLERRDIIVTTRGTVGNMALFSDDIPFDVIRINSGMAIIRNNNPALSEHFLYQLLKSPLLNKQIKLAMFGSAIPQLTVGTLKDLLIPVIPISEQTQIVNTFISVDSNIENKEQKLSKLKDQKKALMNDLLTGKVRV